VKVEMHKIKFHVCNNCDAEGVLPMPDNDRVEINIQTGEKL